MHTETLAMRIIQIAHAPFDLGNAPIRIARKLAAQAAEIISRISQSHMPSAKELNLLSISNAEVPITSPKARLPTSTHCGSARMRVGNPKTLPCIPDGIS